MIMTVAELIEHLKTLPQEMKVAYDAEWTKRIHWGNESQAEYTEREIRISDKVTLWIPEDGRLGE